MEIYVEMVANLGNGREIMTTMELPESGPSVYHETFIDMLTNPNEVNEHILMSLLLQLKWVILMPMRLTL